MGVATPAPPSQWARLTGDEILVRNRYANVEPYANNRIKLEVGHGISDYINASPIVLGKRRYIATQGPKDTSATHFWRMITSEIRGHGPAIIIMLTQTHEAGREKCFRYYPLDPDQPILNIPPDPADTDHFTAKVTLESVHADAACRSEIREMVLETRKDTSKFIEFKTVFHLLFSGWPDFLVPEGSEKTALVNLIKRSQDPATFSFSSHASQIDSRDFWTKPRIVHCSAGVGRSGTFIALDYLLGLLEAGELDDLGDRDPVAETVDRLRQQRMMMVQGEGQFFFLYEVLREQWIERWKSQNSGLAGNTKNGMMR
ncbi:tyrosine protein phosphatase 1 [Elasticomyces elasticus]|nr:tyrosine protein phosphatase 1 [Elasticomyces elasticus]